MSSCHSRFLQPPPSLRTTVPTPEPSVWHKLFGGAPAGNRGRPSGDVGTLPRERKVPIKVEPKVFFANDRTFLAWLRASQLLVGASVAIVAFAHANPWSQLYGVMLLPVAISSICYSMYQCARQAAMIPVLMKIPSGPLFSWQRC